MFAETRRAIVGVMQIIVQHVCATVTASGIAILGVGAWVKWVSILDSKTSHYCRGQSGKVYRAGQVPNPPPAQWGCRSTLVPFFPELGEPDERPTRIGSTGNRVTGLRTFSASAKPQCFWMRVWRSIASLIAKGAS